MRRYMVKVIDKEDIMLNSLFIDSEDIDSLRKDLIRDILHDNISLDISTLVDGHYKRLGALQSAWNEVFFIPSDDPGALLPVDRHTGKIVV